MSHLKTVSAGSDGEGRGEERRGDDSFFLSFSLYWDVFFLKRKVKMEARVKRLQTGFFFFC